MFEEKISETQNEDVSGKWGHLGSSSLLHRVGGGFSLGFKV